MHYQVGIGNARIDLFDPVDRQNVSGRWAGKFVSSVTGTASDGQCIHLCRLDELSRLLTKGGDIGKRLDFLIQELHREANTLGSKSAVLEMTRISVDMKVLIEQMREQVQNIE